jgi:acyl-CoA thioester hydrolase
VRYVESDMMGIVHHSAYIIWFEEGRSAWFRRRLDDDRGYALIEADGYFMALTDLRARYVAPAHFGDRVRVRTWVSAVRSRGLTVSYEIHNDASGTLLCRGETSHLCLDREGSVVAIPEHWAAKLLS